MLQHCQSHQIFHHNAHPNSISPINLPSGGSRIPRESTLSGDFTDTSPHVAISSQEVSVKVRRQPAGIGSAEIRRNRFQKIMPIIYNAGEHDRRRTPGPAQSSCREPREPVRGRPQVTASPAPKALALKTAINAERVAFHLNRTLQQLVVEDLEHANEGRSLPEVRRGGEVVDVGPLLRP